MNIKTKYIFILHNLPNSAKKILDYLSEHGKKTQRELINEMSIPTKSLRYTLRRLEEAELIQKGPNLYDLKSPFFKINPEILEEEE